MSTKGLTKAEEVELRTIKEAEFIIGRVATVRDTAKYFHVSKSTVHNDMITRLPDISSSLYSSVHAVLAYNKEMRNVRGGEATRRKYLQKRSIYREQ